MLGADLVHARRKGTELSLVKLDDKARPRVEAMAGALLGAFARSVGGARKDLEGALDEAGAPFERGPNDRKLLDGLAKLLDDAAEWDGVAGDLDPVEVRRVVFEIASALRRNGAFDRAHALQRASEVLEARPEQVDAALYADLKDAARLRAAPSLSAAALVARWEGAQAQAVLLRAVRMQVWVACTSAGAYRALFHRLKFLRLLYEVHRVAPDEAWPDGKPRGGHRLVVEGPFSMFESVTRYGLKLAMMLPVLDSADAFQLVADVRWGATRTAVTFKLAGGAARAAEPPPLADDVAALLTRFSALESAWSVEPAPDVVELPGLGLCVPDLAFVHEDGTRVLLEVLGFWSRDAVFRRVELVERGLPHKLVFAASKRLRVREDLIDEGLPACLYVYKGTMSARVVLEKLEQLRERPRAKKKAR